MGNEKDEKFNNYPFLQNDTQTASSNFTTHRMVYKKTSEEGNKFSYKMEG